MPKIVGFIGTDALPVELQFAWAPTIMAGLTSYAMMWLASKMPGRGLVPNAPAMLPEYKPEMLAKFEAAIREARSGERSAPVPATVAARLSALAPGRFSYDTAAEFVGDDKAKPPRHEIRDKKRVRAYKNKTSLKGAMRSTMKAATESGHEHLLVDTRGTENPDGTFQPAEPVLLLRAREDGFPTFLISTGDVGQPTMYLLTKEQLAAKKKARAAARVERGELFATKEQKRAERAKQREADRAAEAEKRAQRVLEATTGYAVAKGAREQAAEDRKAASAERGVAAAERKEAAAQRKEATAQGRATRSLAGPVPRAPREGPPAPKTTKARGKKAVKDESLSTTLPVPIKAPMGAPAGAPLSPPPAPTGAAARGGTVLSFEGEGATARSMVKWDDRKVPELLSAFDTKALKKLKVRADDRITRSIKREAGGIVAVFDVEGASVAPVAEPAAEPATESATESAAEPKTSRARAHSGPVFYLIGYTGGKSKSMARVIALGGNVELEESKPLKDAGITPGGKFLRKGKTVSKASEDVELGVWQKVTKENIEKAALLKAARARVEAKSAAKEKVAAGHAKRRGAREKSESARALEEAERVERGERKNLKRNAVRHGSRAAALLVVARDTKRVLIMLRSAIVLEPHTWGLPGGKCEHSDKSMRDCAVREFREETDYRGKLVATVEPVSVYREPGFECHNFVGFVDHEFEPELDDESDDYGWFSVDKLPQPTHFGTRALFRVAGKQIRAMIARS